LAEIIDLETHTDKRGNLTVFEKLFDIKRVFWLYGCDGSVRGGHRHKKTRQLAVCLRGYCDIDLYSYTLVLDNPQVGLLIEPEDWHTMILSKDCILMVFCSTEFDENDYVFPACANKECQNYREMYYPNNCAWFTILADHTVKLLGKGKCEDYIEGEMKNDYFLINQRDFKRND